MKRENPTNNSESESSVLKEQLNDSWSQKDINAFCVLLDELCDRITSKYLLDFSKITKEDVEDCFWIVMDRIFKNIDASMEKIDSPWSYIWSAVRNELLDLIEERKKERESMEDLFKHYPEKTEIGNRNKGLRDDSVKIKLPSEQGSLNIVMEHAVYLIESMVSDLDANTEWAREVVKIALGGLSKSERAVIEIILMHGPDYNSNNAEEDLGISNDAYRKCKSRAYTKLKNIIPEILEERKIDAGKKEEPDIFIDLTKEFPSSDQD